jgi:DNA-binding response OmpR family regulator
MSFLFIVVIDDSATVCTLLETVLTREGHQVRSFLDPVAALRSLLVTGEMPLPDLLFVDLCLPKISGYEVIRRFRDNPTSINIPIIVVTRIGGVITRLKVRLVGANAYLEKPFQVRDVLSLIQSFAELPDPNTYEK